MPDGHPSDRRDRNAQQSATEIMARLGHTPPPGAIPPEHGGRRRAPDEPFPVDDRGRSGPPAGHDGPRPLRRPPGPDGAPMPDGPPPRGQGPQGPGPQGPGPQSQGPQNPGPRGPETPNGSGGPPSNPGGTGPRRGVVRRATGPRPGAPANGQPGPGRPADGSNPFPYGLPSEAGPTPPPGNRPGGPPPTGPTAGGRPGPPPNGAERRATGPQPVGPNGPGSAPLRGGLGSGPDRGDAPWPQSNRPAPTAGAAGPGTGPHRPGPPRGTTGSPLGGAAQALVDPHRPVTAPGRGNRPATAPGSRPGPPPVGGMPKPTGAPPAPGAPSRGGASGPNAPGGNPPGGAAQGRKAPAAPPPGNGTPRTAPPTDSAPGSGPRNGTPGSAAAPGDTPRPAPDRSPDDRTAVVPAAGSRTAAADKPTATANKPATATSGDNPRRPATEGRTQALSTPKKDGDQKDGDEKDGDKPAETAAQRNRRIDETITRITAAHAGLTLSVTDKKEPPAPEPPPPTPPLLKWGRVAVAAVVVMVFLVTAFQYVSRARLDDAVATVAALDQGSGAILDAEAQAGTENVLILASDTAGTTTGLRTDTVVLGHVGLDGRVVGVSFPRSLEVNRPPCERFDAASGTYLSEVVRAEIRTPLISAYDVGGPRCATRVVQQLTGLEITRYVGLSLDGVAGLVDAVGGVEMCVPYPVVDEVLGPVVPEAGVQRLTGEQAQGYVEARTVEGDPPGTVASVERQQRLLDGVLRTILSPSVLLNPGRISPIADALGGSMAIDGAGLDQALAVASALDDRTAEDVVVTPVPTSGETSGQGNPVLREADAAALFTALRTGEPLPEDPGADAAGVEPSEVTVRVVDASEQPGRGDEVAGTLASLGFGAQAAGAADAPADETVIRFSPDRASGAALLGRTLPSARAVPDPAESGVLELVLGRTFDGVVRAPTTGSGDTPAEAATAAPACS